MIIEGVTYYRFAVHFRMADGRRVRWRRWSPGRPWIFEEIHRELTARGIEPGQIKSRSLTVELWP